MQLPHAVSSVGHAEDAHTPATQCPPQHSAALAQVLPSALQVGPPHLPCALHGPEQQGSAGLQTCPSSVHVAGAQTPFVQLPSQQSGPEGPHDPPKITHGPPPQVPFTHGRTLQHMDPGAVHASPNCRHPGGSPHVPPLQVRPTLPQQSLVCIHGPPLGWHGGPFGHWSPHPMTPTACFTHNPDQLVLQQKGSIAQVCATHGPHVGESAAPG
jgi:hypothetical protein